MRKVIFPTILLMTFTVHAVELKVTETSFYQGAIGNKKIHMTLTESAENISGWYEYDRYRTPIPLSGKSTLGEVTLIESSADRAYSIESSMDSKGSLSGVWKGNNKNYNFEAKRETISSNDLIDTISLESPGDQTYLLKIRYKNDTSQEVFGVFMSDNVEVTFEDMNFDGFPDMRILEIESSGNSSYSYFLYNRNKNSFIEASAEFADLVSPKFLHREKTIISINRDGCCKYIAKKISNRKVYNTIYDYSSDQGWESITNKEVNEITKAQISKKYFESEYINK